MNLLNYIEQQEATDISYVKIGNASKNLIVSFAGNRHHGFERKTSLVNLKLKRNDFDIMYFRNQGFWYLGGLKGIGKNITHTISFLKNEFAKYDKIICTGSSAGGYASMLFGSLCSVDYVVNIMGQIDLEYLLEKLPERWTRTKNNLKGTINHSKKNLKRRKQQCPKTWVAFKDLSKHINTTNTTYYVSYKNSDQYNDVEDEIYHGIFHYNKIKDFSSVHKIPLSKDPLSTIIDCLNK